MTLFFANVFKNPLRFHLSTLETMRFQNGQPFTSAFSVVLMWIRENASKRLRFHAKTPQCSTFQYADVCNVRNSRIPLLSIIIIVHKICIFLHDQVNMAQCIFRQDMSQSLPMEIPRNNRWHGRKFLLTKRKSTGQSHVFRHYVDISCLRGFH